MAFKKQFTTLRRGLHGRTVLVNALGTYFLILLVSGSPMNQPVKQE
jgi:hypothetical protein